MRIKVRLFGPLAEAAGKSEVSVEVEKGATAADVVDAVRQIVAVDKSVRIAIDTDYATPKAVIKAGDIVSLIPPVAGG